ncbi:lipase precursor [Staphylococcus xylosus]|uniref:GA-like domain-containing protein n=1 Tax=Staphylococcus xylosus TaxID=1288 RepID=UPI00085C06E0|nr:YSIRK-type signal peptide-containing protein [Staphylococcus xylosus]SCU28127.1 lipase precursor [Staphylococcus xylosus]
MRVLAEYIARRNNKYSIRKFTIGTASVLLGSVLFINQDSEAAADMVNDKESIAAQNNDEEQVISEAKQFDLEEVAEKHSKETQMDENNSNVVNQKLSKSKETNQTTQEDEQNALKNEVKVEDGQRQSEISDKVDESTNYNFEKEQIKKQKNKITEKNKTTISSHKKSSNTNRDNDNSIPIEEKQSTVEKKVENANQIKNNDVEEQKFVDSGEQNKVPVVTQKVESNNDINQGNSLNVIDLNNETKETDKNKPKSRVVRSLNRSLYNSRFRDRRYSQRLHYNIVQSGDYILTAIREVERNREELTEEERKLFLRNIIRQTSLKNNKRAYDSIFNGDYSVLGNRKVNSFQAKNINELLYKMKDLTFNRDNDDYRAVYTFTNQSDVTKNHFGIVEDEIFYNDGEVLIATMVLSKEKGRGTYRFENYGIRPNDSLNKKIKKVFAEYEGRQRVLVQQDRLGYYSYTRPDSGTNGNPNTGGGSGGSVKFIISFDANYYIDVKKDKLFGYILSDTLDPNVLRGVNITNQSVDIDEVAARINSALIASKKKQAEKAIQNAEQAKQFADQKLAEVIADDLVNPSEKAELDQLIEALETAKANAAEKLNNVPDGAAGKTDLQTRLDGIGRVTAPEVNDQDGNGVLDTVQLTDAKQATESVEAAKKAVDDKLSEITADGLVNPSEKAELERLIEALETAKTSATEKLNNVPNGMVGKAELQTRLDGIGRVTAPEVNDQDGNGVLDTEQLSDAEQAIESVEAAKRLVDDKLTEITADGLVNPSEKAELDQLIEVLETAKASATEKLNNVPEGTTGKTDLQTRLDGIGTATSPEVNDKDGNGVLDTVQLSDADQAIETAEEAKRAVDSKLTEITADGLVNPSEKAELDVLIEVLNKAKTNATEKLSNVPEGTTGKSDLQTRLDGIGTVTAPEVNDQDGNGVLDTEQLTDAKQATESAEAAKRLVDDKLTKITTDGLVNPSEKAELDVLIEALETAKTSATEKLNNVPEGTTGKTDLQTRLDGISSVTSPEVNDKDSNGILDTFQLSDAEQAIEVAEEAKRAVDSKLTEITGDGLVNPSEKAEIDVLIEVLNKAKTNATEKLNNVPEATPGKIDLQTRLDGIGAVTSPEVNDKDSNGVLDTFQLSDAEQAIEAAEEAKRAVDSKLTEITSDGLVNPSEKAELDVLIEALETAKTSATEKLNNVPDGTTGKTDLQTRLDGIGRVITPEVNDQDGNGVLDTVQLTDAEQAIESVEAAKRLVDDKLTEITSDGLVNPSEKAELDRLIEALESAKANATEKLNNVPDGTAGKTDLQTRLDGISAVTSPKVNDADSNGVLDTEQLAKAKKALQEVEQLKDKVEEKLAEIKKDGLITKTEKGELDKLIQKLQNTKTSALNIIKNLPNSDIDKNILQNKLERIKIPMPPSVNDKDNNGILDMESPNIKDQNHVKVNKHLSNTTKNSNSDKLINKSVKVQNTKDGENVLLKERAHAELYRHQRGIQQLNVVPNHLKTKQNETNVNSENNMNSITHLPDAGGESKDSWIFGTLLGAIGSMMLLRKRQEKRKEQKK